MHDFLEELDLLFEWYESNEDLDSFADKFNELVKEHKDDEGVAEIANITAHNYNCHVHGRKNAVIKNIAHWREYKKVKHEETKEV